MHYDVEYPEELMSPANEPRLSKAEKTAQAREKARAIREEQLKKEKRNKLLVGWGIVVAVVVIIGIIAAVVIGNREVSVADQGPTPANGNVHGGITLLANTEVLKTEPATVNVADVPAPPATKPATVTVPAGEAEAGKPVKVVAYIDFICPVCKQFESTYGESLTSLRNEGKISVEYRALGFLDRQSTTNYSSRAANAAACVVNSSPEKYAEFFNLLFERQPAEGGAGISDNDLKKMATEIGAANIDSCIDSKQFRPWVKVATQEAAAIGVTGTPTVFIDGKQWDGRTDLNAEIQTAIDAKG
ncbi:putative DSBA-like thioredoxin domain protein [Arthrobacter sp. Rue61a]|jgi:protein-disulfide isomerase|uniref:DSBA-like thioredoxin domain protein n=2 Tax=Micrococcales TaxID=85006 RepID=A1R3B1_PAEAT|nr:putative DSBA-like thioredoxin domain protein [Paenarthrobacter aurescens TC1]AFR27809.1 putative DSBA-like thioredoxin domain protein [Arthrobacter sp. Rue61a]